VYLFFSISDDDDDVPLAKRAKILSKITESEKESNPSTVDPTPLPRTSVAKVHLSSINPSAGASTPPISRDHVSIIFITISYQSSSRWLIFGSSIG
jgi:hypothetical protein